MTPLPSVTAEEMAAVDRAMVALGLDLRQVMEVAGRQVAVFARAHLLGGNPKDRRVAVLAGSGGNGGDALVAARYLAGWGASCDVLLARPLDPDAHALAHHQAEILRRSGTLLRTVEETVELGPTDLILDGLLGFSTTRAPHGTIAALIEAANAHPAPTLAIDVPSGMQATTGEAFAPTIRATATLTLGLPKVGLLIPGVERVTGALWVADIGIPEAAYRAIGREVGPIFARDEFLRVSGR
jgi:NAD(P)H-hydrate epimerase